MIVHKGPWVKKGELLVLLGDSITEPPTGYAGALVKALQPRGIRVVNAGRGGDTTPKALTRLQRDVIERKPAAVSIFLGTNDAGCGHGRWADEPIMPPDGYRANLEHIMYLCRLAGIEKFSITPPLFRYEGPEWEEMGDLFAPYRLAAREAAGAARARFVPADIAFANVWAKHPGHTGLLLTTDGVHLNQQGNSLLAETMLAAWGLSGPKGRASTR